MQQPVIDLDEVNELDDSTEYTTLDSKSLDPNIRSGRLGLSGTVIPRSTAFGRVLGTDPEKPRVVTIDPHVRGEIPMEIDMSKLEEDQVEDAMQKTANISNQRQAAFARFKLIDKKHKEKKEREMQTEEQVRPAVWDNPPSLAENTKTVYPDIQPKVASKFNSPTEVFNNKAPNIKVIFELEGFGTFECCYHKVILSSDNLSLVLVYDTRFQSGLKYFPSPSDNSLYVDIQDQPYIYKVQCMPGHKFVVDNLEMVLLLVEEYVQK